MKSLTQEALQKILESEVLGQANFKSAEYTGLSIDSRTIRRGEIFFAIVGENNDGHDYLEQAFAGGAAAAVVKKDRLESLKLTPSQSVFVVRDTHEALLNLAGYLRRTSVARFAGITGSNGKTTTKEMLYSILSQKNKAYRSPGNLNNLFGLPISLGRMPEVDFAVFELGISVPGEMTRLAKVIKPDLAVITNIGPAHLETLKSIDAIVKAKFELVDNLPVGAAVVLNADDKNLRDEASRRNLKYIGFGIESECDLRAENIRVISGKSISFTVQGTEITLRIPGRINIYNALAAIAASSIWGCGAEEWIEGLGSFQPVDMRLAYEEHRNLKLLIDCYNANPDSTRAALEVVRDFDTDGRRLAVLADMLELGETSEKLHREVGQFAAAAKLDILFCLGFQSQFIAAGAKDAGMNETAIFTCNDHQELLDLILEKISLGDLILFKGSRGMALEKIVTGVKGAAFKDN